MGYQLTRTLPELDIKEQIINNVVKTSHGILHIGAHYAEEATAYSELLKQVIWIEGDPVIFEKTKEQISNFPAQSAMCALLGENDSCKVPFYRTSNEGASSSVFELVRNHGFPNLEIDEQIELPMVRLDSIFKQSDLEYFDHWVIDVQGAELSVLKGAGNLLNFASSILVEASNRPIYTGGVSYKDLNNFLEGKNFMRVWNLGFKEHSNLLYLRKSNSC